MSHTPIINQRLKTIIDERTGGNVKKFAEKIGLGQQRINRLLSPDGRNGKFPSVNFEIIQAILAAFPDIDKNWFTGGSQSAKSNARALPSTDEDHSLEIIRREDGTEFRYLGEGRHLMITPLIEQKAYGGYLSGWADPVYIEELPKHAIVVEKLHFGIYRSFEVEGESMFNGLIESYPKKSIVTARLLDKSKYVRSKLHIHEYPDFVIVQEDGIQIKRIISHNVEKGVITCSSLNHDKNIYPDFELNLADVRELFNVVAKTLQTKA